MTTREKILQLQGVINSNLRPLIDRDYYLLEVPYYTNIGDTLIWQGELDYLKTISHKCLGMCSYESRRYPMIQENALIIFQGGGNFGDLWVHPQEFRMKIMAEYPKHQFLFMPQTVYFKDENNLKKCADFFANYNATICARDQMSYEILKTHFKNNILLVPDMAFCIDMQQWDHVCSAEKPLVFKRTDVELKQSKFLMSLDKEDVDVSDWPTMCDRPTWWSKSKKISRKISRYVPCIYDWFCQTFYRQYLIRTGVKFLKSHTEVYTTRLHGAILAVLLGMKTTFMDNSYGKNRTFYETWLKDCDNITWVE